MAAAQLLSDKLSIQKLPDTWTFKHWSLLWDTSGNYVHKLVLYNTDALAHTHPIMHCIVPALVQIQTIGCVNNWRAVCT